MAVAVADGEVSAVYVVANAEIFARNKADSSGYAAYEPRTPLGVQSAKLLAATGTTVWSPLFVE